MIKVGIIGATHPAAGELLRVLVYHPDVEVVWAYAPNHAGLPLTQFHRGLAGETWLRFTDAVTPDNVDVIFMCHDREGKSREILAQLPPEELERLRIIDISPDFIDARTAGDFVYGIPEANRKPLVRGARRAAIPSPEAMAILLALLPLGRNLMINKPIHATVVHSSHPYDLGLVSVFPDREQTEVSDAIRSVQSSFNQPVNIVSVSGGFPRGMMAVVYMESPIAVEQVRELYDKFYDDHSFTFVSDLAPDIREIVNTNKCMLNIEKINDQLVITAAIDDMLKGSAGNAVHVMNLLFGLQERVGLMLKASGK
ncbi:MAG: hypothetical protein NC336_10075 [Clostridium sp.]|nr:hypothetical protein [Clostridium sp.]